MLTVTHRYPFMESADIADLASQQEFSDKVILDEPSLRGAFKEMAVTPVKESKYLRNLSNELDKYYTKVMNKTFGVEMRQILPVPLKHSDRFGAKPTIAGSVDSFVPIRNVILNIMVCVHHSSMLLDLIQEHLAQSMNDKGCFKLADLQKHIFSANILLDEVLMHFTFNTGSKLPSIEDIRTSVNTVKDILKAMKLEALHELFPPDLIAATTPVDQLCSILGLNPWITFALKHCPVEERMHQTDLYLITRMIEDTYDDILQDENVENKKEHLMTTTFSQGRKHIVQRILNDNPVNDRQPVLYWVQRYLSDLLQYNILLNDKSRLTYDGAWLVNTEGRICYGACPDTKVEVPFVYVQSHISEFPTSYDDDEHIMFFHGTDECSARHIVENGIQLSKGNAKQDFSDGFGFYVTTDYTAAVEWARYGNFAPCAAVVSFKVAKEELDKYKKLDLTVDQLTWRNIENFNRSGRDRRLFKLCRDMKKQYQEADYVEGSVCHSTSIWKWPKETINPGTQMQTCILSDEMAERFGDIRNVSVRFFHKSCS